MKDIGMHRMIEISTWPGARFIVLPYSQYAEAALIWILSLAALPLLKKVAFFLLKNVSKKPDLIEQLELIGRSVRLWFYIAIATLLASFELELSKSTQHFVSLACAILILIQILNLSSQWIRYFFESRATKYMQNGKHLALGQNLASLTIVLMWLVSFAVLFDNFGFNIAALIAGLGIGGIAIGLALQSVLGDFFASFAIGFDKPFTIGDFIITGDIMGTVEKVGLKTTRIRSLGGEVIVTPNNDLVNARIRNYKKMKERRVVFSIGVTYDTSQEHLEHLPGLIRNAVESAGRTRFDRSHFASFGDYALVFETVYYVLSADYNEYMDIQEKINLTIRKSCKENRISFAFPTTTIDINPELSNFWRTSQQVPRNEI